MYVQIRKDVQCMSWWWSSSKHNSPFLVAKIRWSVGMNHTQCWELMEFKKIHTLMCLNVNMFRNFPRSVACRWSWWEYGILPCAHFWRRILWGYKNESLQDQEAEGLLDECQQKRHQPQRAHWVPLQMLCWPCFHIVEHLNLYWMMMDNAVYHSEWQFKMLGADENENLIPQASICHQLRNTSRRLQTDFYSW